MKNIITLLLFLSPIMCFSQNIKDNLYIDSGNYLFVITSKSVYLCRPDKIIEIYFKNNVTKDFYRR